MFEVETQLIKRCIPPHCEFDLIKVERTDFLPLTGCALRQVADMRVSYMNMENVGRGREESEKNRYRVIFIMLMLTFTFMLLLFFL